MTQENSSPSTSIPEAVNFNLDEWWYLDNLPRELLAQLNGEEAAILVRWPPEQWPETLKDKVRPFFDPSEGI